MAKSEMGDLEGLRGYKNPRVTTIINTQNCNVITHQTVDQMI